VPEFQKKKTLEEIKPNHVARYKWACDELTKRLEPGCLVLDAACGIGYGSRMLASAGFVVHAVDRSLEAVHWHFDYFRHANIRVSLGDLLDVPLDNYAAIVTLETIEHIPDSKAWIDRLRAPIIVATVPNENVTPFAEANNPYHYRHFTPEQFDELIPGKKEWFTQYGRFENCEMVPGNDGENLGVVVER
jgi:protein-L-isoaspartate O-methyltransferase